MNETYQPDPTQQLAFCQICGRAVASDADRLAGRAFACGLCNETKLAVPASVGAPYPGSETPGPGPSATFGGGIPPGAIPPYAPPPSPAGDVPNPGLAALLGLIPGVGAMYNGQYAKGIVHLIVFAVLSSLVDTNGIFLLFVFGWVAYQSIEAHHTARARRDGTPLPNPFGLNDIGEKLGFGKSWPNYPSNPGVPPAGPGPAAPNVPPPPTGAQTSNWGAPFDSYRYAPPPVPPYAAPPVSPYAQQPPNYPPYQPVTPPPFTGETYVPFDPNAEPPYPTPRNRFPAGAIWLIALGTLFLLNTSGIFRGINFKILMPLFFVGLGIWMFVGRMTRSGHSIADDGSPEYRVRFFRAARGAVWLILLGVVFFLDNFDVLPWSRSWPLFLILAGVMAFVERAVYRGAGPTPYNYGPPNPAPPSPFAPNPGTAIVPTETAPSTNSQEGR